MNYLIYKYTSKTSGKSYIGQTNNPVARKKAHAKAAHDFAFASAIKKYGFEDFDYEILEENLSLDDANARESFYIESLNTLSPNGYNLRGGGGNAVFSEESRLKLSQVMTGKQKSEKHRQSIAAVQTGKKRKPHSEEVKMRIRLSNLGKKRSEETRLRVSLAKSNISEETRLKLSAARKGKTLTDDHKQKISTGLIGHVISEETKAKIGNANLGKVRTEEIRKANAERRKGIKQSEETKAKRRATWEAKRLASVVSMNA